MFTEDTVIILGAGASWHYGYPTGEELIEGIKRTVREATFINYDKKEKGGHPISTLAEQKEEYHKFVRLLVEYDPLTIDSFLYYHPEYEDIGKVLITNEILRAQATTDSGGLISRSSKVTEQQELLAVAYAVYSKLFSGKKPLLSDQMSASIEKRLYFEIDQKLKYFCKRVLEKGGDKGVNEGNWYKFLLDAIITGCSEPENIEKNNLSIITFNYDVSLEYFLYRRFKELNAFFQNLEGKNLAEEYLKNKLDVIHV